MKDARNLSSYESSRGKHRFFCKRCGTQVYAKRDSKNDIILRLVSLDTPLSSQELAHTWVSDAVDWFDIDGMLPKYEKGVPATNEGVGHISFMLAIGMFALVSYSRNPIVTPLSPHA